jgi:uncharacterized protein (TIGR02266 family)
MADARQVGIGAARDARALIAGLLDARAAAHPTLADDLAGAVAYLYGAEVANGEKLRGALGSALERLRAIVASQRYGGDPTVGRALSRACALLHPAWQELGRTRRREDGTAPFLLAPARIKAADPPEDAEDRREALRLVLEAEVGLTGHNRFYTGRAGDLSRGGLFVATESPLAVGTPLSLHFVLPGGHRVSADAEVAWVRAPRYRPHELPAGMGVRFLALAEPDLGAIRHFLEERPAFHYGE